MGNYESVIDVGNQTTYNFSDLEDGKAYYFVVTAYDILGRESDFSSELRYPEPFSTTMSLSSGLNLISLPLEPLNPSISSLTEQLSPCLLNVSAYVNDTYAWEFYDPAQLDQSTLGTMEPSKGYWVEMTCPGEMTVVGNRTTNPITLIPGLNLVGYNSLKPLPVSVALSSIADKYTTVWAYENDAWKYYNPADVAGSTLQILSPGSGYWIEVTEETTWYCRSSDAVLRKVEPLSRVCDIQHHISQQKALGENYGLSYCSTDSTTAAHNRSTAALVAKTLASTRPG
jgi:hypothetical protein